jgi:hypothetical protein
MENIIASDFEFDDARTASVVDDAESQCRIDDALSSGIKMLLDAFQHEHRSATGELCPSHLIA